VSKGGNRRSRSATSRSMGHAGMRAWPGVANRWLPRGAHHAPAPGRERRGTGIPASCRAFVTIGSTNRYPRRGCVSIQRSPPGTPPRPRRTAAI
jgi:hypothetical protein